MRDVAVFVQARTGSRRCPDKMLRPFAGTTLIDICLDKLAGLSGYPVYFGAHESALLDKAARRPGLTVVRRSRESAESHSDPRLVFEMLAHIHAPYVCWINPCHPFLTPDTVHRAIERFAAADCRSMTSVVLRQGWFYDAAGAALTNRAVKADTSQSDGLFEVAHAFHIYERERMLVEGRPWDNGPGDPLLHEIPVGEAWDIDTTEQFTMVEALYRSTRKAVPPAAQPGPARPDLAGCRVVVTGAGGFLGRALVAALAGFGCAVGAVTSHPERLAGLAAQIFAGDFAAQLEAACAWAGKSPRSACAHLAGLADAQACDTGHDAFRVNVSLLWETLAAAGRHGLGCALLSSSGHVYGQDAPGAVAEDAPLLAPGAYAASKAAAEAVLLGWGRARGVSAIAARLSNVYGPGMSPDTALGTLAAQLADGRPVRLANLAPVRDFIALDDAAEFLARLLAAGMAGSPLQAAVNVSTGQGHSLAEAARLGLDLAGREGEKPASTRAGAPGSRLVLDNGLLARITGCRPSIDLKSGLARMLEQNRG